jgi:TetR/AcrR family transcriptional repressor of bet genes
MNKQPGQISTKNRTESKETRRLQLIQATMRSIASHSLSETTVSTVLNEAGLSRGIINLHFQSKEKLLLDTLAYVVDEYKTLWEKALLKAGDSSAERLKSLVRVDFHRSVCDRNKLSVWFAFWSETKSRPTYRKLCAERDLEYDATMLQLCTDVIDEGQYTGIDPEMAAIGLSALTQGLWLDMLVNPRKMSRKKALKISMAYLSHLFPGYFPGNDEGPGL